MLSQGWHGDCFFCISTPPILSAKIAVTRERKMEIKSNLTANKGFTLIEIIVILAVISILVAILTPTVLKYIDEARDDRAKEDVKSISAMLNDLIKDTGQYPGNKLDTTPTANTFLCGPGNVGLTAPQQWGTTDTCEDLANHLVLNNPGNTASTSDDYPTSGKFRWKGPYITNLSEDPWGNAYQINASTLTGGSTSVTWVISAGPDATFQTSTTETTLSGDDLGVRIK